jgi:hypothetical protein
MFKIRCVNVELEGFVNASLGHGNKQSWPAGVVTKLSQPLTPGWGIGVDAPALSTNGTKAIELTANAHTDNIRVSRTVPPYDFAQRTSGHPRKVFTDCSVDHVEIRGLRSRRGRFENLRQFGLTGSPSD